MGRLRRSDVRGPGWLRVRRGRGFRYLDAAGNPPDAETLARIEALAIPPAWREVWICPYPNGHIQALGTDAAGRRQYRYHDDWRRHRDRAKHDRLLSVASRLPAARAQISADLDQAGLPCTRVLAAAARLLDVGFFRIGSEQYAEDNGTYGLTTLLRRHVRLDGEAMRFDYTAKSGRHRVQTVVDPLVLPVITELKGRRGRPAELLCCRQEDRWRRVDADDVNRYLQRVLGSAEVSVSAKDFRTWHATVLMAVALAVSADRPASAAGRQRVLARAYREVAHYLGNTPAVCRSAYVDPRVADLWADGHTIRGALDALGQQAQVGQPATQGAIEQAVLALLRSGSTACRAA